jgi:hypothetical protein
VAVEVAAFVDVALAFGVDEEAERIIVLLELVADREVAIGRRIDVPGDRMAARPIAVGPRPDIEPMLKRVPRDLASSQLGPR